MELVSSKWVSSEDVLGHPAIRPFGLPKGHLPGGECFAPYLRSSLLPSGKLSTKVSPAGVSQEPDTWTQHLDATVRDEKIQTDFYKTQFAHNTA